MTVEETNLSLEERSKFESLLAEYANAEMDLVRATGRAHDALHRVLDYVNRRTREKMKVARDEGAIAAFGAPSATGVDGVVPASEAHKIVSAEVPTGTCGRDCEHPCCKARLPLPIVSPLWENGVQHVKELAPVADCQCATCCEARALASIGTPSETQFGPPPGQYSGN